MIFSEKFLSEKFISEDFQPWKYLPATWAHALSPYALEIYAEIFGQDEQAQPLKKNSFTWRNLYFPSRCGIAGGVDKNADSLSAWQKVGAGFLEIGTVTPEPQDANPGRIIARQWEQKNLWNKMGFPNLGAQDIAFNLRNHTLKVPVFINVGKNRWTENKNSAADCVQVMQKFSDTASAFVVNISSPNTQGLRELVRPEFLQPLCTKAVAAATGKPVLLKLSPDMSPDELQSLVRCSLDSGISGFILSNTTLSRSPNSPFPESGGVSGRDLTELSRQKLKDLVRELGQQRQGLLLVSVGGIDSVDEMNRRLDLGADLVQVYSALVFQGPGFFMKLHRG
jgi:dihydroorotate dehydrogenase